MRKKGGKLSTNVDAFFDSIHFCFHILKSFDWAFLYILWIRPNYYIKHFMKTYYIRFFLSKSQQYKIHASLWIYRLNTDKGGREREREKRAG